MHILYLLSPSVSIAFAMMASCDSHTLWRGLGSQQEPVRSTWGEDAIVNVVMLDARIISRICIALALLLLLPTTNSLMDGT